jgi:phage virion morphogenesis protein
MGGITLKVEVKDKEVRGLFAMIELRGGNPRPALASIGEYMLRRTDERFSAEQDAQGQPWAPLSPETLKHKKHTKILTESGNLRGRIVYRVGVGSVAIGTNVIYGAIQQLGGKAGKGHKVTIPARPYLGVNDEDEREFAAILSDYLLGL